MLQRIATTFVLVLGIVLTSCSLSPTAGLTPYIDAGDGYQFLYPLGWQQVQVSSGPDIVFHDLIQETENVSVVISPVTSGQTLKDLGTPTEVGYTLQQKAIAPPDSGRTAELVNAYERESGTQTYYILEYEVTLPNQKRHDLATVAITRNKLYTLNVSALESRWPKVSDLFERVVQSFSVASAPQTAADAA
ncbi:MAG: photosystem II reaction center PsbP [Cyanobacteria bacterium P01_H01_bin.121]